MKFKDVPVGDFVVLVDKFGGEDDDLELRLILYRRLDGVFANEHHPEGRFIPAERFGFIQGEPGHPPRYRSVRKDPIKTAVAGLATVLSFPEASLDDIDIPTEGPEGTLYIYPINNTPSYKRKVVN